MAKLSCRVRQIRVDRGLTQLQLAVNAGLAPRTIQSAESGQHVSRQTAKLLADALEIPESVILVDDHGRTNDGFLSLPWSVGNHLKDAAVPKAGSLCRSEQEVCEVVAKMRENFREQICRCGDRVVQQRYEDINAQIDRVYFRYERHYVEIWKKVPQSILVDRNEDSLTGVSVVVPVKAESYRAFCRGEKSFIEIDGNDTQPQSQYLILDSATEFVRQTRRPWYQLTKSLSFVTFSQIAMLSIDPRRDDFSMASFFASPVNQKRLGSMGFVMEEREMSEFDYQLCRFGNKAEDEHTKEYVSATTLSHFAFLAKKIDSAALKRSVVTRLLSTLKQRQTTAEMPLTAC